MSIVIMSIGLPGSGKTTMLKQLADSGSVYICPDDIRKDRTGDALNQTDNQAVWEEAYRLILEALELGQDVIIDVTNARAENRLDLIQHCRPHAAEVIGVWFKTPLDVCRHRNQSRDRIVPDHALVRMDRLLNSNPPQLSEGFDELIEVV